MHDVAASQTLHHATAQNFPKIRIPQKCSKSRTVCRWYVCNERRLADMINWYVRELCRGSVKFSKLLQFFALNLNRLVVMHSVCAISSESHNVRTSKAGENNVDNDNNFDYSMPAIS